MDETWILRVIFFEVFSDFTLSGIELQPAEYRRQKTSLDSQVLLFVMDRENLNNFFDHFLI